MCVCNQVIELLPAYDSFLSEQLTRTSQCLLIFKEPPHSNFSITGEQQKEFSPLTAIPEKLGENLELKRWNAALHVIDMFMFGSALVVFIFH